MIGLLGGTFDPIHYGHLHVAHYVQQHLSLETIQFIPCHTPPHDKVPHASPADRLAMVQCAIKHIPNFVVNPLELNRGGISYTVDTVLALSDKKHILFFIMGEDSFCHFDQWEGADLILEHCHLIIAHRPQTSSLLEKSDSFKKYGDRFITDKNAVSLLSHSSHGYIYRINIPPYDISATQIRKQLAAGLRNSPHLPPCVQKYIIANHLFK